MIKMFLIKSVFCLFLILFMVSTCFAETIYLKDGSVLKGEIVGRDEKNIYFETLDSRVTINKADIIDKMLSKEEHSPASDLAIGFVADAKFASKGVSIGGYSSTTLADPMIGLGVAMKKSINNDWSLLFEVLFNTGSGFANANGGKANLGVYPIELNLQRDFGGWYLGGGVNYSLWNLSSDEHTYNLNGFGVQFYGGWDGLFTKNSDLEIKYTYMTASISLSGETVNPAFGTLSIGTKIWLF